MFTKEQKEKLRRINQFNMFQGEKKGEPYKDKKKVIIPDFWEIRQDAIGQILKNGFLNVEIVEPRKANCIIRVFTKRHFECQYCGMVNLYGFNCFVKQDGKWISGTYDGFEITYKKCEVGFWLYPDEYVRYDCDYVDCYVKVTCEN